MVGFVFGSLVCGDNMDKKKEEIKSSLHKSANFSEIQSLKAGIGSLCVG